MASLQLLLSVPLHPLEVAGGLLLKGVSLVLG